MRITPLIASLAYHLSKYQLGINRAAPKKRFRQIAYLVDLA